MGSSPLARGLLIVDRLTEDRVGIIPARAGFTPASTPGTSPPPDHPRSRGVYASQLARCARGAGSSPLARGLHPLDSPSPQEYLDHPRSRGVYPGRLHLRLPGGRIIPARAGFTAASAEDAVRFEDHPRSRGVYAPAHRCARDHAWIIPARAGFTPAYVLRHAYHVDHPRSRGVYCPPSCARPGVWGSSPLARGLQHRRPRRRRDRGIIPARAGFTRPMTGVPTSGPDHPRSRGVYRDVAVRSALISGSSPLARGLLHDKGWGPVAGRIIPARAGFTAWFQAYVQPTMDHPRSRGVYPAASAGVVQDWGSSPLARGLLEPARRRHSRRGIIPARAGFTPPRPTLPQRLPDHPRSRGVYRSTRLRTAAGLGSSPLARGLRRLLRPPRMRSRIIPARAGFTAPPTSRCGSSRDHPRSRGVYGGTIPAGEAGCGSSPLARGLRPEARLGPPALGIIPARAGFTFFTSQTEPSQKDHPRSRGVYSRMVQQTVEDLGSSPLARGLRRSMSGRPRRPGIIPARAGFTTRCAPRRTTSRDHPRSRGVYAASVYPAVYFVGSSPLARGLQHSQVWQ